jgi:quercetin dioxygenase-like cupin family protein
VYWQLHVYADPAAARRDGTANGVVTQAFAKTWLFTIGPKGSSPAPGMLAAEVGPIAVDNDTSYDAEFLQSTFSPGMRAPVHVHSGPEAFYAVSGDTCLETPDGVQFGRGPGNSLVIRAGPPMLLVAPGPEPRRGFALILHDRSLAPTTLVHHWTPKGLCHSADRAMH